jgi:hypothetical protein
LTVLTFYGYSLSIEARHHAGTTGKIMARTSHSYFVVMVDYGRRGQEAIVDPEVTRSGVISRLASGEYGTHINFIHHIDDGLVEDVTSELFDEAEALTLQAAE